MEQTAEILEARRSTVPSSAPARMTGAQILWEVLAREGVEVVFGYPGGAIMPAYDALPASRIHHVLVRHEQGAAHMADGYARASGKVGVCIATSGPGATNLVTGIATAMLDSIPLVCITGQVSSTLLGSDAFQEIDITGITLPITKHNYLVTRAEDLAHALREAFEVARSGRPGPVLVDVTKDAQQATVPFRWSDEPVRLPGVRPACRLTQEQVEHAASFLDQAKRPLVFCGHGVIRAGATELLLRFAEKTGIPVASTLLGLGAFPASHELSLGMMGMHGEAWVNHAVQEQVEHAASFLDQAKRPLVFCGHGVIRAGATEVLLRFAEKTGIPVASTLLGLGAFPASHELSLGMMGMHGEAWVNHAVQESDLLVAVGMRFDDRVTGNLKNYATAARKIHLEIDPAEVNKNVRADVALVGDLRRSLERLLPAVAQREHGEWRARIQALREDSAARDVQGLPHEGKLRAPHVLHDLWCLTRGEALVVTDVGQHQMWEAQYYRHERPRSLLTSGGLGTMGFALPAAIGARFARPQEEIWVVVGDGGFQMTACELITCAQEGIKLNVALINNGYLGMVRQWQEFFYGGRYVATPLKSPDFVKLAEAHGLTAMRVTTREQIGPAVEAARKAPGTAVIEFCVEGEEAVYPMVPANADLHAMIRRPSRIEESIHES